MHNCGGRVAVLTLESGERLTDLAAIGRELAPLGVGLNRWPLPRGEVRALLDSESLDLREKSQVMASVRSRFDALQVAEGIQDADLIVLHSGIPGLQGILAKFSDPHTHADDEIRYIVDGSGIFGFVRPDGSQVGLTVEAEEFINVPAGVEHWFVLTESRRIKAVRYFTDTSGWTPAYTGTKRRL